MDDSVKASVATPMDVACNAVDQCRMLRTSPFPPDKVESCAQLQMRAVLAACQSAGPRESTRQPLVGRCSPDHRTRVSGALLPEEAVMRDVK